MRSFGLQTPYLVTFALVFCLSGSFKSTWEVHWQRQPLLGRPAPQVGVQVPLGRTAADFESWRQTFASDAQLEWLHIPKAGTSFGNSLVLWACPELPPRVWVGQDGVDPTLPEFCRAKFRVPPTSERCWRPGDHVSLTNRTAEELRRVFAIVRSPQRRLASGYHYAHMHRTLNATEGEICAFAHNTTAAHAAVGAQARMIVGHPVHLKETREHGWLHHFDSGGPPGAAVAAEACAQLRQFAFVGLTDEWTATVCLFHAMFGGEAQEVEHVNTRLGDYSTVPHSLKWVECGDAADDRLFACARAVFMAGLTQHPHCAGLLQLAEPRKRASSAQRAG